MKKLLYISSLALLLAGVIGLNKTRHTYRGATALAAHAGGTITRGDSLSFDILNGSATGGTPPYTYSWRTIAKPNANAWCANIYNPTDPNAQVGMTGVFSSPFGTAYKYELTVTDAASNTAKDTAIINVTYSTPSPPQATGTGVHYVTSADSLANLTYFMSPARKDVWIDGAGTDAYNRNTSIDSRNQFALHNNSRCFISAGKYFNIILYLNKDSILCDSLHPARIVPVGGQVEWFGGFVAGGCWKNIIFSGKYDQVNHTGSAAYPGHDGGYAFSSGTYGFYANNHWTNIDNPGMDFGNQVDSMHNVEISYVEGPHGGTYFLLTGKVDQITDVYSMSIHDNYGIDSRSEMNYWMRTQNDPQQHAKGWRVYNNRFVRSGLEDDQFGQQTTGNWHHNNVYWMSAMNWISPFEANQAFNNQGFARDNGNINENNIYVGSGEQALSGIMNKPSGATLASDTNYYRNDLFFNCRGSKDAFFGSQNAGHFNIVLDNDYFGFRPHIYLASIIYNNTSNNFSPNAYPILNDQSFTPNISYTFRHIRYDTSGGKSRLTPGGTATTTYSDTARAVLAPLAFVNSGFPDNATAPNICFRWAYTIGSTNKDEDPVIDAMNQGTPYTWQVGTYCMHLGWVYLCKVANTGHPPARVEDTWWHPVTWTKPDLSITHTPPDDLRLPSTDFYAAQGIGLLDQQVFIPPTVNAGVDQTITLPTSSASLSGTATGNGGATISTKLWTKISGPGATTITGNTTLTPTVSGLQAGVYVFQLSATDSNSQTSTDQVQVIVNPAIVSSSLKLRKRFKLK